MESITFSYKMGSEKIDSQSAFEVGPALVTKLVTLFQDCAYAPSNFLVGEFVSQVLEDSELPGSSNGLVLATYQEQLIGALFFRCVLQTADLDFVAVLKRFRGNRIGRKLILEFERLATIFGCERAMLEVSDRNISALATYRSVGYEEVGRRKRYYSSGEDAIVFEKLLEINFDTSDDLN